MQKGDKPYNALKELMDKSKVNIKTELKDILFDTLPNGFSRVVSSQGQYVDFAKEYSKGQTDELEKWKFDMK